MIMNNKCVLFSLCLMLFCTACQNKHRNIDDCDVSLVIPQNTSWTYYGKDTISNDMKKYDYTLVKYVGKESCIPCILGYQQMSMIISRLNLRQKRVGFRLIFADMPISKIYSIAQSEGIVDPICVDSKDKILKNNPYLSNADSCVVLLDAKGNPLLVGNPLLDISLGQVIADKIWDNIPSMDSLSNAEISERELYYGKCVIGDTVKGKLLIKNTGSMDLIIKEKKVASKQLIVDTKQLVKPNSSVVCNVQYIVNEKGYFCKDVVFISNSKNPLHFKVSGIGIE